MEIPGAGMAAVATSEGKIYAIVIMGGKNQWRDTHIPGNQGGRTGVRSNNKIDKKR